MKLLKLFLKILMLSKIAPAFANLKKEEMV